MAAKASALASSMLIKLAREAVDRLQSAPSDLEWAQHDAAVAIVFSAAAVEALVSDFAVLCDGIRNASGVSNHVGTIADALVELEKQRASVRLKLLILKAMLPGEPFDTGKQPFQDITFLIDLRDSLIHLKPVETTDGSHKMLNAAVSRGIASRPATGVHVPWLLQILTRKCAQWTITVVETLVARIRADGASAPFGAPFTVLISDLWGANVVAKQDKDNNGSPPVVS